MSSSYYRTSPHLELINSAILEAINGSGPRIIVLMAPPRHGKSFLVDRHLPAWFLGRFPSKRVILVSAEASFARKWGREARGLLDAFGKEIFDVSIREDVSAASEWEIAGTGGGMFTVGAQGVFMGRGADLLIADDLVSDPANAFSETWRDTFWEWWQSTPMSRREPGAVTILMGHRWHADDIIGRVIANAQRPGSEPIRVITMPAIAEEGDELGRQPGEPLWPEIWPLHKLEEKRDSMDIFWWQTQYQQRPSRHGRTRWPDEYFHDHIWCDESEWPQVFEHAAVAVDPSQGKDENRGDPSAIVFAGTWQGTVYVDCTIERRPVSRICNDVIAFGFEHKPDTVGFEANAFQELIAVEFERQLQERGLPAVSVQLIHNRIPKELRIGRLGPYFARRKIRLRRSEGCKVLVKQLQEYPLADHDDGPDGLEMAIRLLNWLSGLGDEGPDHVAAA